MNNNNNLFNKDLNDVTRKDLDRYFEKAEFQELYSVPELDIPLYMGKWYEIGSSMLVRLFIETLCVCTNAVYSLNENGSINVLNTCNVLRKNGNKKIARGTAIQENPNKPGQLTVSFRNMVSNKPNYYIIHLDEENGQYKNALIGDPSRLFLWILSREPTMEKADIDRLLNIAKNNGYNLGFIRFRNTNQSCFKNID